MTRVEVEAHFVTAIRMPDVVNSVAVGDPALFQVEHSPNEPQLVFVKPLVSKPAETNLLISTGDGRETSLLVISKGAPAKSVDFVVNYERPGSFLIEPDYPSPLVGETVAVAPAGSVSDDAGAGPAAKNATSLSTHFAGAAESSGRSGQPSITVLDECWALLDSPTLAPEVVQLFRTARKRHGSVWGISQTVEDFVGTESQPRVHGPGILKNSTTKIVGQQPGDTSPLAKHLFLNPVAIKEVKEFSAPRKGQRAEALMVLGEKAETTQVIRLVPTAMDYWVCTTFPRERRYRNWFLAKHKGRPLIETYWELAQKFPRGLAELAELPEEISGAVIREELR